MSITEHLRITPQTEIDALETAVRWPDAASATVLALVEQLSATRRYDRGYAYFDELARDRPEQPLFLALAGLFQARSGRRIDEAVAKLDTAVSKQAGLPHYFRGLVLAELPVAAARSADAVADLQLVLSLRDRIPVGLRRSVYLGLARVHAALGQDALAADALAKSGVPGDQDVLTTDYSVTEQDGFRFGPKRIVSPADGVHVAQGYDFADIAFVTTDDGIVMIDTGSTPANARAALAAFRGVSDRPITHVILTHGHWDHTGGLDAVREPGTVVIAQAGFAAEQAVANSIPLPYRGFAPADRERQQNVVPDLLVGERQSMNVGGTDFVLYPAHGGETHDALIIHLPQRHVVFSGDVMMPYLGAPFLPEGSADGLFEAMSLIERLVPKVVIHGHTGLTRVFTADVLPALRMALEDLHRVIVESLADGATVGEILRRNHLSDVLRTTPGAVIPYLVMRDNVIKRVHRQRTGYWQPNGDGIETVTPSEWAAVLDLLAGGREQAFVDAVDELNARGEDVLALKLADHGLSRYPASTALASSRQSALKRLVERNQGLNPFKFVVYSELAGLRLAPMTV